MFRRIAATIIATCLVLGAGLPVQCEDRDAIVRVLVLPFDGASAGQYEFLTGSVGAMIAGRLAARDDVTVVDYSLKQKEIRLIHQAAAKGADMGNLFARLQTDFVVTGAIYALQAGLQIQVTVSDLARGKEAGSFTVLADSENKILSVVEGLSQDIAVRLSGETAPRPPEANEDQTVAKGLTGFATEHPDRKYKKGIYSGGAIVGADGGETQVAARGVRKSSTIPSVVVSMAVGDLDGNGGQEIVFATRTAVEVYSFADNRFQKLSEYEFPANHKIHAVNIADLDGNGKGEIYVSANRDTRANSSILAWSAKGGVEVLAQGLEWYLRPVFKPGEGVILVGQRSNRDPARGYIGATAYKMKVYPGFGGVREDFVLALPKTVQLFDFEWADIDGDAAFETIAVDRRQKLLVYDSQNSLVWVSSEDYGGSRNFVGPASSKVESSPINTIRGADEDDRLLSFVPTRILVTDIDGDGRQEVIVGKNRLVSTKWLSNTREYDGGSVACLSWRGAAMQELWRTNNIAGYIADYAFIGEQGTGPAQSAAEDGRSVQLYVGQVPSRAFLGFMIERESKILRYDLDLGVDG